MSRTTIRTALPTVATCLLAVLLVAGLSGCGARRSELHRNTGDNYLSRNMVADAKAEYERSIKVNPENPLAHLGLARCAAREQAVDESMGHFTRAIELNPQDPVPYGEAVEMLLDHDRVADAKRFAERLEKVDPEMGGWLRAHVLKKSGDAAAALALLESMKETYPDSARVRIALALDLLDSDPAKAEAELKEVLEIAPDSLSARMTLVQAYRKQNKGEEMLEEFEKLVEQEPTSVGLRLGLAQALLDFQRGGEAEALARELHQQLPDNGWTNYVLGECISARGAHVEALPYLEQAARLLPDQPQVSQALELAQARGKRPEPGPAAPAATAAAAPEPREDQPVIIAETSWRGLWRQAALGDLLMNRGELLKKPEPDLAEVLVLSALFTLNPDMAKPMVEHLPEDSPLRGYLDMIEARDARMLKGIMEEWEAKDEREGADEQREIMRRNAFGFALNLTGARTMAIHEFSKLIERWPDHGVAFLNIAQTFRNAGVPEFAARALQQLLAQYPQNANAHALLYTILREGNLEKEAYRAAETSYALFPEQSSAILNLAKAYRDARELDLAKEVLRRGVSRLESKAKPETVDRIRITLAGMDLESMDPAAAAATLDGITSPLADSPNTALMRALAAVLEDNWPRALEITAGAWGEGIEEQAPLLAASAYLHGGQPGKARSVLEKSVAGKEAAKGIAARVVLAALGGPPIEAGASGARLAQALKDRPAETAVLAGIAALQSVSLHDAAWRAFQTEGASLPEDKFLVHLRAASLVGARSLAMADAAAFTEAHPDEPIAWLARATFARRAGDTAEEDMATARAVEVAPAHMQALFRRGQFLEQAERLAEAADVYRQVLAKRPEDPAASNNLAYLLLMTGGDPAEALKLAQVAAAAMPRNASVAHTLGVCQLRTGDHDHSKISLENALQMRPGDPTLLLDYSLLMRAQGFPGKAKTYLEEALRYTDQMNLDFPRRTEAEEALASL